jgi:glycine cleavage system H protein
LRDEFALQPAAPWITISIFAASGRSLACPPGTIGITHHAQNSLGDIVFVELPKVGAELVAGKSFGTVESVKAVSDLYAPVSGTVTAINEELATAPEKVNNNPHTAWMVKITLANPSEADGLLSAADYEKFIAEEQ